MKNPIKPKSWKNPGGFTLIELIVVIAIIAILMGIGATTMKNVTTARGVNTGVPMAEGVFSEARSLAKGRGVDAYVVIYADTSSNDDESMEKRFRYMGVATNVQYDADGNPTPGTGPLRLTSRGVTLPSQVYFNANLSGLPETPTGSALFPGSDQTKACYVYRFNSEGILVEPAATGADGPQALFVLQSGTLAPGDTKPRRLPKNEKDIGGFAIWRSGQTSLFRNPDQILEESLSSEATF